MCWSKTYDKVFHINNSITNQRICDIHLITVHRMAAASTFSVNVNDSIATMEGQRNQGCCGETHIIKNNMPITIKFSSIPFFEQHNVQFVLDMAPLFDKPLTRSHLYIDGKNVMDSTRSVTEFTESGYTGGLYCLWWLLWFVMCIVFTLIYAFILMLFIGIYSWIAIEAHVIFGAYTWMAIYNGYTKALCDCCQDPNPSEVDVQFNPNTGGATSTQQAAAGQQTVVMVVQQPLVTKELVTKQDGGETLPEGWTKMYAQDGRVYYQNEVTKKTQWEKPVEVVVVTQVVKKEEGTESVDDLPEGWMKMKAADGRDYYQNNITKQTQWERPVY